MAPRPPRSFCRSTRSRPRRLEEGDSVIVVGGGPAGALFAHYLLSASRRLGRHLDVVVVEKHGNALADLVGHRLHECNHCAGGISPRLNEALAEHGLALPDPVVQERIDCVWLHGQWKNFRLPVPAHLAMSSVYRGSLPARRGAGAQGLDEFLLGEAVRQGARVLSGEARSLARGESGRPLLTVTTAAGEEVRLEAAFVAVATGINVRIWADRHGDTLTASLRKMQPRYVPARSRKAFIFELDVGEDYLRRTMHREIHFIEYGSRHVPLEHAALIPKGRFLTAVMIGRYVDEAVLPHDSRQVMHDFLALPQINQILPGVEAAPVACICCPRMAVAAARAPFGDGFAMIGDAVGARLYKDGLFSAHMTAEALVRTLLDEGLDQRSLARGYGRAVRWLDVDNRYGRIVFHASRLAFSRPAISRVIYQAFATELKRRDADQRPFGTVLWKIASGIADYRDVLWDVVGWRSLWSLAVGVQVTLRNLSVEAVFGLEWGRRGRYPTVVPKEARRVLCAALATRLGVRPWEPPEFERMYTIVIRGSQAQVLDQLGRFGDPQAAFLQLRFVEIRRIQGTANRRGSVICYTVPRLGLRVELRLAHDAVAGTLLYEVEEYLVNRGKLVFSVVPARDGNCELTVYASFDYRRGTGVVSRALWRCGRAFFPAFVHDVVWNHALCTIKEMVEQRPDPWRGAGRPSAQASPAGAHAHRSDQRSTPPAPGL